MMSQPFQIREAIPADIPFLRELIEKSVRGLQESDYSPLQIEGALSHALGLDTQLIEDRTYFAAFPMARPEWIIACGGWSFRKTLYGSDHGPGRTNALLDPAMEPAKIRAIFVHPEWARKGLGTLLLKHCEAQAEKAGFRSFDMGSTLTGVPLYTLMGYRKLEDIGIPLPNGEVLPVVHMLKELDTNCKLARTALSVSSEMPPSRFRYA